MKNTHDLGKEKIGRLLISLAIPAIISQIVNMLYNMVDRIFIGKTPEGDIAMAALGIALPVITIVAAFAQLLGAGGAPLSAIKMGEKKQDDAEKIIATSFVSLITSGIFLTIILLLLGKPILYLFGANQETIQYALSYISIYAFGTIFVQITLGMNAYINCQGFATIGMTTVLIGAVLNILLDPIFIFGFRMGVSGAALATILSQAVSGIWVLKFLFGNKNILRIRKRNIRINPKILFSIMALGISPFIMQTTESLVQISFNTQLDKFGGNVAVSGITILYTFMTFVTLPVSGLAQGAAPIISFNYGARNYERVRKTVKLTILSCLLCSIIITSTIIIFSRPLAEFFIKDDAIVNFTAKSAKVFLIGITIFGAQLACQNSFMALGQAKISMTMALLRKVVLLIPLIYLLPNFMTEQVTSVLLAEPISDIVATLATTSCFAWFYKKKLSHHCADA